MLTVHLVSSSQVLCECINKPLSLCRDKLYASLVKQPTFVRFVKALPLKRTTPLERVNLPPLAFGGNCFSFVAKRHRQEKPTATALNHCRTPIVVTRSLPDNNIQEFMTPVIASSFST